MVIVLAHRSRPTVLATSRGLAGVLIPEIAAGLIFIAFSRIFTEVVSLKRFAQPLRWTFIEIWTQVVCPHRLRRVVRAGDPRQLSIDLHAVVLVCRQIEYGVSIQPVGERSEAGLLTVSSSQRSGPKIGVEDTFRACVIGYTGVAKPRIGLA